MAGQYPPPANDPYTSRAHQQTPYFSADPANSEFSPFFTSDYLPLSTPATPSTTIPPSYGTSGQSYSYAGPPPGINATGTGGTGNISGGSYNDIEEEKRRRNTAASARFRVKKKEREQVLEKTANEVRERVRGLESRVQMLERENGWLRGLVGEKRRNLLGSRERAGEDDDDVATPRDERRERERESGGKKKSKRREGREGREEEREERGVRSPRKRNDGVGTK